MAQKPPDEDGLPWGLLPSGGPSGPLRERERDLARRGRSFISRDKEKETTRPAWTINSLPDTHARAHTHSRVLYKHLKTVTRRKKLVFESVIEKVKS